MAKKPTFQIRDAKGQPHGEPIPYHPLQVTAGAEAYKLALHTDFRGAWIISDPISGGKVLDVPGCYKGVRVSSAGYTYRQIHPGAQVELDLLIQRVGAEKFNQVLAKGRAGVKGA